MTSALNLKRSDWPDTSHLITEDDEPVDNPFQERQGRLLAETLYASWTDVTFLAFVNVGLFHSLKSPGIAPDLLLSMDVLPIHNPKRFKRHKAYFIWEYGKIPDLVIEVVSNTSGGEDTDKLASYARMGVAYYIIYDPARLLSLRRIRAFKLSGGTFVEYLDAGKFCELGLGLTTWEGTYDGLTAEYLRFTDVDGRLLPTKGELTLQERARAEHHRAAAEEQKALAEEQKALAEEQKALAEEQKGVAEEQRVRAERLAARLKELGVEE